MKKYPSNIQCRDSNPWPLDHESAPITTRPGLLPLHNETNLGKYFSLTRILHLFSSTYFPTGPRSYQAGLDPRCADEMHAEHLGRDALPPAHLGCRPSWTHRGSAHHWASQCGNRFNFLKNSVGPRLHIKYVSRIQCTESTKHVQSALHAIRKLFYL